MDGATPQQAADLTPAEADLAYLATAPKAHRRRFAQVLTPPDCAAEMADWVAAGAPRTLLDPAFGTGILARAVTARCPEIRVTGYEIDPQIAAAGQVACAGMALDLRAGDFLDAPPDQQFDAVIANPPFLRPGAGTALRAQVRATAARLGVPLSGLTNAYALFVFEALARLAPGGRAAFLLPAEWANANTGAPLKEFLISGGYLRKLIYFCALNPVFDRTLTTASLVLLQAPRPNEAAPETIPARFVPADGAPARDSVLDLAELRAAPKWDALIRTGRQAVPAGFVPLGALAATRRGIATGANGFFHLTAPDAAARGLRPAQLLPCVAKAGDVAGLRFSHADFAALEASGRPTRFFAPQHPLNGAEAEYVAQGAAEGLDQRFLTRNRTPWYAPERIYLAPIWAATFGRGQMRFILNEARVWQLTAFHGLFPIRDDVAFHRALVACLNSAPVQDLMRGSLRIYARGLQKLEPRDLLEIPVPDLRALGPARLAALGRALVSLEAGRRGAEARLAALVMETAAVVAAGKDTGKDIE
jgi:adenine-specific DNA-methyltransferase